MLFLRQLGLLLWKNSLLQRRQWIWTSSQFLLPIAFSLVLLGLRQVGHVKKHNATYFEPFPVTGNLIRDGYSNGSDSMYSVYDCFAPTKLAYAPMGHPMDEVMQKVKEIFKKDFPFKPPFLYPETVDVKGFHNESDMVDFLSKYIANHTQASVIDLCHERDLYFGGVVFDHSLKGLTTGSPQYRIRLSNTMRNTQTSSGRVVSQLQRNWKTADFFQVRTGMGPRGGKDIHGGNPNYFYEGFLTVQRAVDRAIISSAPNAKEVEDVHVSLQLYPFPAYTDNVFVQIIQGNLPTILMISFIISVLYIARNIGLEKEARLKEYMSVMGLDPSIYWLSHFISNFVILLLVAVIITILYIIPVHGRKIITVSDPSVLFVFLIIYSFCAITFSFMISTLFKKGNTAAGAAFFGWLISDLPYSFLNSRYSSLSLSAKLGCSLFINTGMSFGVYVLGAYEGTDAGLQWSTINTPVTPDDNLTMLDIWIMLLFDSFCFLVVAWYTDTIRPGAEGIGKPWYFLVTLSYWKGLFGIRGSSKIDFAERGNSIYRRYNDKVEIDASGKKPVVILNDVTKVYGRGKGAKTAVDQLNFTMQNGEITALLGQNGAGKSTTVSMLTGLLAPTAGSASIMGVNIVHSFKDARKYVGFCPQHSTLFDLLTVREHLRFFCGLKGRNFDAQEQLNLLTQLNLEEKTNSLIKTLSGGMRRKMSLCIALIGGSEVVLLDEPSSGMDPGARQETWRLLQEEKSKRAILITTHYMEEADALANRIAIVAHGQLQCFGSSLFLKNRYGAGYHLAVVFRQNTRSSSHDHAVSLLQDIRKYSPNTMLEDNIGSEALYLLPNDDRDKFEQIFAFMENNKDNRDIDTFGVSLTTLEEVFLRVSREAEDKKEKEKTDSISYGSTDEAVLPSNTFSSETVNTGVSLKLQQFWAMLVKRFHFSRRSYQLMISQIVVPFICVLLALVIQKTLPNPSDSPALILKAASGFKPANIFVASLGAPDEMPYEIAQYYHEGQGESAIETTNETLPDLHSFLLADMNRTGLDKFNRHNPVSAWFGGDNDSDATFALGLFNGEPLHTPAMALSAVDSAIYAAAMGRNSVITTVNHPLPPTTVDQLEDWFSTGTQEFLIAFELLFGFSFMVTSFVVFLVKERVATSKHLQFLSGIDLITFWSSNLVWDFISYFITVFLVMILFAAFNVTQLIEGTNGGNIFLLFVLYGLAILPMIYSASFLFDGPTGAFVKLVIFNILTGLIPLIVNTVLVILADESIQNALEWVFMVLFPNFNLGQGIVVYFMNQHIYSGCEQIFSSGSVTCDTIRHITQAKNVTIMCCRDDVYTGHFLSWGTGGIGKELTFLTIQAVGYFTLLCLIELNVIRRIVYGIKSAIMSKKRSNHSEVSDLELSVSEDSDVKVEKQRVEDIVMQPIPHNLTYVISNLTKYYGDFCAVNDLSFLIQGGDCFGLLGSNGAGKTSTFKMLTGENSITSGNAFVKGLSIKTEWKRAGRHIGYCPQFDATLDDFTGLETLVMYGRLRGVLESEVTTVAKTLLQALGLTEFTNVLVKNYSGGSKRKLSLGVALIGQPAVLLLDEPTSGVDPKTRRFVWQVLTEVKERGVAILLSSHSMEECEALCTRMSIMSRGGMRCIGSTQHLKSKYGRFYTIQIKPKTLEGLKVFEDKFRPRFPSLSLREVHHTVPPLATLTVAVNEAKWSELFGFVHKYATRPDTDILDYSIAQTSMEQVFLSLTMYERANSAL